MADTRSTQIGFFYKVYLCLLAILNPKQLLVEEKKDNDKRESFSEHDVKEPPACIVNQAFWSSLWLIIIFGFIGIIGGILLNWKFSKPTSIILVSLQTIGASLLLWGTLFVRGWQIQTYCGVTLSERVNLWLYRSLYCIGTSIIISSIAWSFSGQ
jgi:hypothetical protein